MMAKRPLPKDDSRETGGAIVVGVPCDVGLFDMPGIVIFRHAQSGMFCSDGGGVVFGVTILPDTKDRIAPRTRLTSRVLGGDERDFL